MKIKLKKEPLCILAFIICVLFVNSFEGTTSRYLGELTSENDVIAIPILSLSNNGFNYTLDNMLPGVTKEYEFIVSNVEDGRINEILLSYNFNITLDSKIPLQVKLFNGDGGEIPINGGVTSEESLNYGGETSKGYKIQVIWDKNDNSYEYAGLKATLKVDLKALQVL